MMNPPDDEASRMEWLDMREVFLCGCFLLGAISIPWKAQELLPGELKAQRVPACSQHFILHACANSLLAFVLSFVCAAFVCK